MPAAGARVRTTIVLPRDTLRRAKLRSVSLDTTLSDFIAAAVEDALGSTGEPEAPPLPIGKYAWGGAAPSRRELYGEALRATLPD